MRCSSRALDSMTVGNLCGAYRQHTDYDFDAEDICWERVRLRHTRAGQRKVLVVDYRDRMEGFGIFSLITYSEDDSLPVRCYTFCGDTFFGFPKGGWLRENNGDMTSTLLTRYDFDVSWHTLAEVVRIHEKQNPLEYRCPDDIFPDV